MHQQITLSYSDPIIKSSNQQQTGIMSLLSLPVAIIVPQEKDSHNYDGSHKHSLMVLSLYRVDNITYNSHVTILSWWRCRCMMYNWCNSHVIILSWWRCRCIMYNRYNSHVIILSWWRCRCMMYNWCNSHVTIFSWWRCRCMMYNWCNSHVTIFSWWRCVCIMQSRGVKHVYL